ncbi:MAG: Ger(x)C family spore germination protein [Bacillota bacterium]|nr:Ger(x)C family spore germination protein [Bacillota bacterium]
MKRKIALAALVLLLLFAAGCWNRVELEQRAIVAGFGADQSGEEGKIEITVQVIKPGEIRAGPAARGGSPKAVVVYNSTGYTFFDTLRNLTMLLGKKLFVSEAKIMVVGEELAREDIGKVTDFYDRDHELSTLNFLLIAQGEAREILETEVGTEKIWAYGIADMVKAMKAHGKAPATKVQDFLDAVESKTTAPVAAAVQVVRKEKEEGEGEEKAGKEKAVLPKDLKLSGAAVFRKYQLAGWLDEKETRGLLWVTGKIKSGIIVAPAPGSEDKLVAFEIIRASARIRPEMAGGNLTVTVEVKEEGNLGEVQPDTVDITRPGVLKELEERKRAAIEDEIIAAVIKAQELNADIFGFGEAVRRKYPREWKQLEDRWDEIFPALEVNMAVEAKIRRTGKITKTAEPKP